jgi:hypothetical protein
MSDHALNQVIDLIAAVISAKAELDTHTVVTDRPADEAFDEAELPAINIYAESIEFDAAYMQGHMMHTVFLNCDVLRIGDSLGQLSRRTLTDIGHIQAAIKADFNSGIGQLKDLQDIEEINVAPPMDTGLNISGASLQYRVTFYTPTDDPFTLIPAN